MIGEEVDVTKRIMSCACALNKIYECILKLEGEMKMKVRVRKMKIFGDESSFDCSKVLEKGS